MMARLFSRRVRALEAELAVAKAERKMILGRVVMAMDRIGMARSLAHDINAGYFALDCLMRLFGDGYEPISWRERRHLVNDLRAYAATLPVEEAKPVNIAATRMATLR